jgi:hypothetical protein
VRRALGCHWLGRLGLGWACVACMCALDKCALARPGTGWLGPHLLPVVPVAALSARLPFGSAACVRDGTACRA